MDVFEFRKVVVPGRMRSPYWKYFGFPSDDADNILTKKKIICTICNTVICYNRNSTNLRTHLVAKHPNIYIKISEETQSRNTSAKIENNESDTVKELNLKKRPRNSSPPPNTRTTITKDLNSSFNIEIVKDKNVLSLLQEFSTDEIIFEDLDSQNKSVNNQNTDEYTIANSNIKSPVCVKSLVQNMIINDLLDIDYINGNGFMNLIVMLGGELTQSNLKEIGKNIVIMYQKNYNKILKTISNLTQTFSLGLQFLENFEGKQLLNIYITYLAKDSENTLDNIFCKCVHTTSTNIDDIFREFDLRDCAAVVFNERHHSIEQFFLDKNVPIIQCLNAIVYQCLKEVFDLQIIRNILNEVKKLMEENCAPNELESMPEIKENDEWSKYNFLKYINNNVSFHESITDLLDKTKIIYDLLYPLKNTLETVLDETASFCSLMKPLTMKLIDQKYTATDLDSEFVLEIKNIINEKLTTCIIDNTFLSEASFLDPRFQSFLSTTCIKQVERDLIKKFNSDETLNPKPIKVENNSTNISKKSSLKIFLEGNSSKIVTPKHNQNSYEHEIKKYLCENNVDLEYSPILWWNENGFVYKQLRKVSFKYFCVSCCSSNLFRRADQNTILSRMFMLTEKKLNQLWFLNYNKNILES